MQNRIEKGQTKYNKVKQTTIDRKQLHHILPREWRYSPKTRTPFPVVIRLNRLLWIRSLQPLEQSP
jgi:hypothetical protein